jgi:hypothetical protein
MLNPKPGPGSTFHSGKQLTRGSKNTSTMTAAVLRGRGGIPGGGKSDVVWAVSRVGRQALHQANGTRMRKTVCLMCKKGNQLMKDAPFCK